MPINEKRQPGGAGAGTALQTAENCSHHAGNSADNQRLRILDVLSRSSLSTIEARRDLDIMMPAARIKELRDLGYKIVTIWTRQPTEAGILHRVARYVLIREGEVAA